MHDLRARKVLAATEQAQVAVPSELAVLGVDDDAVLCTISSPTLSSIPTFDRSLGYAAGRALNEILLKRARGRVIHTSLEFLTISAIILVVFLSDPVVIAV